MTDKSVRPTSGRIHWPTEGSIGRKTNIARPDLIHRVVMQRGRIVADVGWTRNYEGAIDIMKEIVDAQVGLLRARTANDTAGAPEPHSLESAVLLDYAEVEVVLTRRDVQGGRVDVFKRTHAVVPDLSLSLRDLQERYPNSKLLFTFPDELAAGENA